MIAVLTDEPAAGRVERAVEDGAFCSWINLGEALYVEARRLGWDRAAEAIDLFAGNVLAEAPDPDIVKAAAAIKVEGGLSYSTSFAVATAERHAVPLLTGDREIVELNRPRLEVVDLLESA